MAIYLVLNPPGSSDRDERALFIRDGFSLFGFLLPPVFLIWHRLWLVLGLWLAGSILALVIGQASGLVILSSVFWIASALYFGLEGANLRLNRLLLLGWNIADIVLADSREEAEILHFDEEDDAGPSPILLAPSWSTAPGQGIRPQGAALGLVDPFGGR